MKGCRFTLFQSDGTGIDVPLCWARVVLHEEHSGWWLSILGGALAGDWAGYDGSLEDEFFKFEIAVRVAGPDPVEWSRRHHRVPDPPRRGAFWTELFHAGWQEQFAGCDVSLGPLIEHRTVVPSYGPVVLRRVAVRVTGCGSSSGCVVRVIGDFEFKQVSAESA